MDYDPSDSQCDSRRSFDLRGAHGDCCAGPASSQSADPPDALVRADRRTADIDRRLVVCAAPLAGHHGHHGCGARGPARQCCIHANVCAAATAGSVPRRRLELPGGRMPAGWLMLEKRVPKRIFRTRLRLDGDAPPSSAVALPAVLPPPMPLSIFVLAAGALKVSKRKFLTAFTISRAARHCISAWVGAEFGRHALRAWRNLSAQWATPVEITLWVLIGGGVAYGVWRLWAHIRNDRKLRRRSPWKSLAEDV
jgi:hypothetical protein